MAIKSFKHKGLKKYYYKGDSSKLQPFHVDKISDILDTLEASHQPKDMKAIFGNQFAEKTGSGEGVYSVEVNGNWRITYQVEDDGAVVVDYLDYHGKQIKKVKR